MGSQTSKQDTAVESCLADFPEQERTHLLRLFDQLCKGSSLHTTHETEASQKRHGSNKEEVADEIDPEYFDAYFGQYLPPPLLTCFRVTMQLHSTIHQPGEDKSQGSGITTNSKETSQSHTQQQQQQQQQRRRRSVMTRSTSVDSSSRISKYGWVMTIHRLSKTSIEEQASLSFMLQTHGQSLESFVNNVTRAVMVFWLAGEVQSWKEIEPEDSTSATTEFLLTRHLDRKSGSNSTEMDLDLDLFGESKKSTATTTEDGQENAWSPEAQEWLAAATQRQVGSTTVRELSRSAFLNWYQNTVEYQILFTILIQNLFLRPPTVHSSEKGAAPETKGSRKRIQLPIEQENKLCQKNFIAPRIKGGLDLAPHFSRLLTVADLFQLRYALPASNYGQGSTGSLNGFGSGNGGGSGGGGGNGKKSPSTEVMYDANGNSLAGDEARRIPPFRLLFSSKTSGASFSTLLQKVCYQGPTLVVMKDEDGHVFGAYADQDWEQGPKFFGTDRGFLFSIRPKFRIYRPSRINNNFQYLDSGTKTLPNGMGFGGQLRYFGLWLASDFHSGQSAAEPLCSTYQSPRLSKQQNFKLDEMEVWQIHPSAIERDDIPKHSAMDAHPDAVALLEMANRKMYSKDVRPPGNVYDSD